MKDFINDEKAEADRVRLMRGDVAAADIVTPHSRKRTSSLPI